MAGGVPARALACGRPLPVPCARAGALPGKRAVVRVTARQAPGRRGNLPGDGLAGYRPPVPGQPLARSWAGLPAAGADGLRQGSGDGQQN